MRLILRSVRIGCGLLPAVAALALCGCNRAGMTGPMTPPISVTLPNPDVVVVKGGEPEIVEIQIVSTSETAVVSFNGIPGDVQVQYYASDTSPSGDLKFIAGAAAPVGTYMPTVTAKSAEQTASTTFTLQVEK